MCSSYVAIDQPDSASLASLREYSLRLIASYPSPEVARHPLVAPYSPEDGGSQLYFGDQSSGELTGCREAVEILTRNMRKGLYALRTFFQLNCPDTTLFIVSYDVTKDGVIVAVLTFTKSAYRLGETITGVVEFNERASRARVLKVSKAVC